MLSQLYIRNYALIEELRIDLGPGLNILTGETGAGKSLLLGAIGLILGKRVDYSYIFNPESKCIVEASFRQIPAGIRQELQAMEDFDLEDEVLLIRREASASGKSRAFVNDTPVSLQVLRAVTSLLVDLHGQHENQLLLSADNQIRLLDQYTGISAEVSAFGAAIRELRTLEQQLHRLQEEEKEARQREDYLRFQLEELTEAKLVSQEEVALEEELELLQNGEGIMESLQYAGESLYDGESSIYNQLSETIQRLEQAARVNSPIREQQERLKELRVNLQEAARDLEHIRDGIDVNPERLATVESRVDTINRLKLKFSAADSDELIAMMADFAEQVGRFDSLGDQIDDTEKALQQQKQVVEKQALELEYARMRGAAKLKKEVDSLLKAVALKDAEFDIEIKRQKHPEGSLQLDGERIRVGLTGINQVDFRIRTNKGMPMGSLAQIASGGEVSRVMLAIKAALADKADLSVLIFDEIDTGISGETARMVGQVMRQLAGRYQLIAITHLPQIAGQGDQHFNIYKEVKGDRTVSHIIPLHGEDRIMELARMLSGADPSPSAIKNARELISSR